MSEIIRVEEDGVEFFTVEETGESGMSQSGLARLCDVNKSTIGRLMLQVTAKNAPTKLTHWNNVDIYLDATIAKKGGNIKLLCKKFCLDVIKYFYTENCCSLAGSRLINMPFFEKKRVLIVQTESGHKHALAKTLNGKTEIPTLAGNIDVLTTTEIIEVKSVNNWKHAIGQVLIYGKYFPNHRKRIHLFGQTTDSYLELIVAHANEFNNNVTWEL